MHVRLLVTAEEREAVYRLTHQEFARAGYIEPRDEGRYVHYQGMLDVLPQTDVFLAYEGDRLVGTNTLTRDSDGGIHTLVDFPLQTMSERLTGKNLASSWRIIVDRSYQSLSVARELIKATVQRGVVLGVETCLYTFHPKHALAYMKMLNAEVAGFNDSTSGLHNAPALLLRGYTKDIPEHWLQN